MSAPLEFLKVLARRLRTAGIPFAITSGMACVHYGLQQTTKDSDWIIPVEFLAKFRELLSGLEQELPPWRVSYRQIFGAPLEADFMQHGWTSHLAIWDNAESVEHRVDLFSKPPRVKPAELMADSEGWASQHVVAQMKKTDRDRDWPMVDGLAQRLWAAQQPTGLLHLRHAQQLRAAWLATDETVRNELAQRRPLLQWLKTGRSEGQIERLLLLERLIWEKVNDERYGRYARAWKEFYRRWRQEAEWNWPSSEAFSLQHVRVLAAAHKHRLPTNPFADVSRQDLVCAAVRRLGEMGFPESEVAEVLPPVDELLP